MALIRKFYIYCLFDPIDGIVRYIGCTSNPKHRLSWHCGNNDSNKRKDAWTKDLKSRGLRPMMYVFLETVDKSEAAELEKQMFKVFDKGNLYCLYPKGEGYAATTFSENRSNSKHTISDNQLTVP